jgi:hypothetical protein
MVVLSTTFIAAPRVQAVLMTLCAGYITTKLLGAAVYYVDCANHAWTGLWTGLTYTCVLLVRGAGGGLAYDGGRRRRQRGKRGQKHATARLLLQCPLPLSTPHCLLTSQKTKNLLRPRDHNK